MNPTGKIAEANLPATGVSALAAWAAVWMVTGPWRPIVEAVETMIANMATVLTSIPTKTSRRARNRLRRAARLGRSGSGWEACGVSDSARISSMRWPLCQKNM